jgi:tetratricopeptide (TPR) repeat protein
MLRKLSKLAIGYMLLFFWLQACSSTRTIDQQTISSQQDSLNKAYGVLHYKQALALMASKRYENALGEFRKAKPHINNPRVFNASDKATFYNAFGKVFFYLNQKDSAKFNFDQSLALNPGYVEVYNNLGYLAFMEGNSERAIAFYNQALAIDPGYELAKENIALVKSFVQGKLSWQAYGLFEKAGKIKNLEEQIKIYTRIVEEFPLFTEAYNNLAVALYQAGEYQRALTLLEQLILIDQNYAMARNNLGYLYLETGFVSQAIEEFLIAVSLKENFTLALLNLSTAYIQQAGYERAKLYAEKVLSYDPQNAEAWQLLKISQELILEE